MQISSKADHETIQIGLSLKITTISVRLAGYFVGAEWLTKWIVLNLAGLKHRSHSTGQSLQVVVLPFGK